MKTVNIDGEEYRTLDDHECVPITDLATENGYKILKKVEKQPEPSPLDKYLYTRPGALASWHDGFREVANWLVDELNEKAKNLRYETVDSDRKKGYNAALSDLMFEAKRIMGQQ